MGLALGPVARLWTRALQRQIYQTAHLDRPFLIFQESQAEVQFWWVNFDTGGYPIWSPSPKVEVITYSDASGERCGGFAVQLCDEVARSSWSHEESGKSSTFREVTAIRRVLESFADEVRGKDVLHRTDNKNAEIVLSVGSRNKELHMEAVYRLCRELDMHLTVEWVSRDENARADELSRLEDSNDYMLHPACFYCIDALWGPYTFDRFASLKTKQLERYCSRYYNPGCVAADAFIVS